MNKRIQRNLTAGVLALSLAATLIPAQNTAAAKAKLNRKKITLYIGNTFKLKLRGRSGTPIWRSSNKRVAKVNKKARCFSKTGCFSETSCFPETSCDRETDKEADCFCETGRFSKACCHRSTNLRRNGAVCIRGAQLTAQHVSGGHAAHKQLLLLFPPFRQRIRMLRICGQIKRYRLWYGKTVSDAHFF